jgi:hypothetical protein
MRLFLYGTLLDPAVLTRWSGDPLLARRLRPATLPRHRRRPLRRMPYPTLVPDRLSRVTGATLTLGPAALRRLAAYEGPLYRLHPLRLAAPPRRAWAWIAWAWIARRP